MTSQGLLGSLSSPISSTNYRARDPTCPHVAQGETNNFVINDGFYRKVSSDRIEVLATSAFLSDDSALYDPCKDLYLQAVSLTVKGHVKWNGRNVYITAVNLTVVGDTAIIDASYQSRGLPNYDIVADDGVLPGDPGRDGQPGGRGQQGGEIKIHVGFLFGGQLVVKAAGGKGGDGQDGGNGREGSAGLPNRDSGACCSGRSTRGHEGGKGGDGGKPGKAGDGGRGGDIQVLFLNETWKDLRLLKTSITPLLNVSGGESGAPGSPGKPGHGGPGGMGSQTRCRTHGWWFRKKKMCEGPNDDSGPRGQTGKTAPPLKPAKKGPDGFATCRAIQMNEFSKYVSKELVQIAFREGNRYYKNGEFESARDVYIWVYLTSRESNDTENQLCASQSVVYLRQMAHGLDYWAHGPNNVPTNSYNNIYSYLTSDIIPYAKNVEADYDLYFDKSAEITRKLNIIKEGAAHNRFNMEVLNEAKEDKANELTEVKVELDEIIHNQLEARVMAEGISSNCKNAVDRYLFDKSVKMLFKDILNIISSAINIFSSVVDGATSLAGAFGDFVGALEAMNELSGKDFIGKISGIETIIKNISEIFDRTKQSIDSTIDNIEKQYNKIKDALESVEERNSAKIVVDGKELEKLLDEYLFLPECTDAKSKLRNYISISQSVNDKILHHDSIVLRIAALEAQIVVLESEETHLRSQESKEFDPNTLSYAIAVSRVYIDLKDSIVNQMKRLQEAYNYQFLDNRVFRYDDSRIAMIEAWVANNRMHMMDRIEMMGSEMQTFNLNSPPMTNSLILKREDNPKGFHELDQTGLLMFSITGEEDQLAPLTNVQILDVRVWVPGVKIDKNSLIVWLKRYGTSTVYDQDGDRWTFTHAPRTMLFSYNIDELAAYSHSSVSSNHLSYYIENTEFNLGKSDAFSSLSPIGPWAISISSKYNPGVDTRGVEEIYLQLAYTFLPCSPPVCHPQSLPYNYSDADIQLDPHAPDLPEFDENEDIPSGSDGIGNVSIVVVTLAAFVGVAVVTLFVAVLVRGYRKKRQVYDNISMTWDYSNNERAPLTAVQAERPDPWDDDELDKSKRRI
uniref:Uncharacterized protein LOC100368084 n=1 Tax=Saccoglossus kowalevskii TaxID=10224 RepID=A0ABM0GVX5_SACKO|nr:PREDICTED: uncharacterized protein LOC100368084 [Saccoglossus kowalevskii]